MKKIYSKICMITILLIGIIDFSNAQITAPFTEEFNSTTTIPTTWNLSATSGGPWRVGATMGYAASTITDHTGTAGSSRAWMDFSGTDVGVIMMSDTIDVSSVPNAELSFFYNSNLGTNTVTPLNIVFVEAYNGTSWSILDVIQQDNAGIWSEHVYDLCSVILPGNKVLIRFRAESGGHGSDFFHDVAIDDISVDTLRSNCLNPAGLIADNLTDSSATLRWSAGCNDTGWSVIHGPVGFAFPSGGTYTHVSVDSLNVSSLMANTSYDFYVRSYCNLGDTSIFTGPITFRTACGVNVPSFTEDFTGMTFAAAPVCWEEGTGVLATSTTVTSGNSQWQSDGFANVGFTGAARLNICCTGRSEWLISPSIDLGTGAIPYQVEFNVALTDAFGARVTDNGILGAGQRAVLLISTDNGVTWSDTNILQQWDSANIPSFTGEYFAFDLTSAGYTGIVKIALYGESNGFTESTDFFIDDFAVVPVPTCPRPLRLRSLALLSDSVNLTWDMGANDSIWEVQYGTPAFPVGTGTSVASNNDTVGINGLTPNTTYDFYVRSICHVGDTSVWIGPLTVTTPCSFFTPTYTEDFTGMTFATPPSCWDEATGILTVNSSLSLGTSQWTSDGFANVGFTGAARLNICCTGRNEWLISPSIDLGTGAIPYQVEFNVALTDAFGARVTDNGILGAGQRAVLLISTDNGVTWSDTNILQQWDSANIPSFTGEYFAFDLTSAGYTGQVRLAFYGESNGFTESTDLSIDDFAVVPVPTCPRPLRLRDLALFSDSINLTWDMGVNDSIWEVQYGASGFALGTGTLVPSNNDTIGINGLSPSVTYDFYVRSICHVGDTSVWIGPLTVTTPCSFFTPPYTQDFSTMTFATVPGCWDEGSGILTVNSTVSTGTSNWGSDGFAQVGFNGAAKLNIWTTNRRDWLISPSIDLGTGAIPYQVEFDIALNAFANTGPPTSGALGPDDKFVLLISPDNGVTWSDTNILRQWDSTDIPSNLGEYFSFNLTAAGYTGQVRLAFYGESTISNEDTDLTIDNFGVVQVPTCPRPLSLTFDSATTTTANISWTSGAADSSWILEYGVPGFTPGTGTVSSSATNPAILTGLMPSTCYEVYLTSICAVGDTSIQIGPLRFCTDCAPVVDLCEDFEGYSAGELPICWEKFIITTGSARVQINTFGGSAAPSAAQLNAGNDGGATMFLISPEMTALSAGTHRISFWADGSFNPDTVLIVGTMSDPTNPGTFNPVDTITTISAAYQFFRVAIPATTDTRIAFQYVATATFRSITIDDFCFETIPSCEKAPFPTVLNDGIDSTTLNLGWNVDTTQTSFIINYGPTGYDPVTNPAGGVTNTSTFNFFGATGLNSLTEYCFWIKAICSNGDTSAWAGPFCGKTGCPSGVSLPYFEDFTNYTSAFPLDNTPQCWAEATGALTASGGVAPGESQWEPDGFANVGFTGAARINFSAFTARQGWLLTPRFSLGTDVNMKRYIEFDIALTDDFATTAAPNGFGADDTVAFVISYDGGVTWKNTDILLQWDTSNAPGITATHIEYSLNNAVGNVQFGFYGTSQINNEGVDFFVDNFSIRDTVYAGVEEVSFNENFKVFPNPNNGVFTIMNEGDAHKSNVKLLDIQGRVVYDNQFFFTKNARKQIEVNKLNSGVYILLLQSEGKLEQHRIVIE